MQCFETEEFILKLKQGGYLARLLRSQVNRTELTINLKVDDERLFGKSLQTADVFPGVSRLHAINDQRPVGWILFDEAEPGVPGKSDVVQRQKIHGRPAMVHRPGDCRGLENLHN